jgi:hypothetical protein
MLWFVSVFQIELNTVSELRRYGGKAVNVVKGVCHGLFEVNSVYNPRHFITRVRKITKNFKYTQVWTRIERGSSV